VKPEAESRVFLFPYAGGGPAVFSKWNAELPENIEAQIVHYPGRGSRHNETPIKSVSKLTEEISQGIQHLPDKQFVFFGHSLGGLIAFELARYLHQKAFPQPVAVFISACGAPHVPDSHPPIHTLPDGEFIDALKKLNGTPQEIIQNQEMLNLLLPVLRTDFEMIETYKYVSNDLLDCPIIAIGGLDDKRVSSERLEGWEMYTSSKFELRYFPGDHFFINTAKESVIDSIVREVDSVTKIG